SNAGYAARFDWRGTAGTAAGNGIVNIDIGAATIFTAQIVGLEIDLQTNHTTTNNVAAMGLRILTPATTAAAASGVGAISVLSRATAMRISSFLIRNTSAAAGGVHYTEWDDPTTLTGSTHVYVIDAQTNVTGGSQEVMGVRVLMPTAIAATSAAFYATSAQSAGSVFQAALAPLATNATVGLDYDRTGAPTGATTYTGNAINIQNTPTEGGGGITTTENGVLILVNHAPVAGAGAITDTTTGISVTMTPVAAGAVTGASITMGALATGAGLLITHNRATAAAGTVALRITGADESVCIEMTDGDTVGLSAVNEGRIIYNTTTQKFQISENNGAYVNMV
ncbi:MAG: hypothetical protein Q8S13_01110, partial [Dehalococcoidia bacterium]|nr:hypothetical protein [Dehalococcoidia bacterium]